MKTLSLILNDFFTLFLAKGVDNFYNFRSCKLKRLQSLRFIH